MLLLSLKTVLLKLHHLHLKFFAAVLLDVVYSFLLNQIVNMLYLILKTFVLRTEHIKLLFICFFVLSEERYLGGVTLVRRSQEKLSVTDSANPSHSACLLDVR